MTDLLALLQLIRELTNRMRLASELATKMQAEGRVNLTDEEKATLRADDDAARANLVDAIDRARAEGR